MERQWRCFSTNRAVCLHPSFRPRLPVTATRSRDANLSSTEVNSSRYKRYSEGEPQQDGQDLFSTHVLVTHSCLRRTCHQRGGKIRGTPPAISSCFLLLFGCVPICLCSIVIYHIISRVHRCHHVFCPCQVGSPELLVTNVSPQPLKSKGSRVFF